MVTRLFVLLAVLIEAVPAAAQSREPVAPTLEGWLVAVSLTALVFGLTLGFRYYIGWLKSLASRVSTRWRIFCTATSNQYRIECDRVTNWHQAIKAGVRQRQLARQAPKIRAQMEAFAPICIQAFEYHYESTPDRKPQSDVVYDPMGGYFQLKLRDPPDQPSSWIHDEVKVRAKLAKIQAAYPRQPFEPTQFNPNDNGWMVVSFTFHPQRIVGGAV